MLHGAVCAQEKPGQLHFKVAIGGDTKGFNKVYCYGDGIPQELSQELKNGFVEFNIPFDKPAYYLFCTQYDIKVKGGYQPFGVLIDQPGAVTIVMENVETGLNSATITGPTSAVLFKSFSNDKKKIYGQIFESVKKMHGKGWVQANDPDFEKINKSNDSLTRIIFYPFVEAFIYEHRASYASVFILNEYKDRLDTKTVIECFEKVTPELRNSTHGKYISAYLDGVNNSIIGTWVKDFSLQDDDGKTFSFGKVKGKYIVLDFWASWCGPCRESFPHMRAVHDKYKERGVVFLNISIDKDPDAWLKAVKAQNNPWTQLLDNKDVSLNLFAVTSVPTTYLIDPEGKFLIKEVGFKSNGQGEIENKLKLIFGF
jgi:thiol-disulfide isomerase/thioredoxin